MTKPILPSSLVSRPHIKVTEARRLTISINCVHNCDDHGLLYFNSCTIKFSRLSRSIKIKTKLKNLLSQIYRRLQQVNMGSVIHFVSPVILTIVAFTAIRDLHATMAVRDPFFISELLVFVCVYNNSLSLICHKSANAEIKVV